MICTSAGDGGRVEFKVRGLSYELEMEGLGSSLGAGEGSTASGAKFLLK